MSISLDFALNFLRDSWGPYGLPQKNSDRERHFQGTQVSTNIARFCTIRYETFSLKKSMSISLDFAFYVTLRFRHPKQHLDFI